MARIERIFLRPSARTPVREVERTEALAGRGLAGDHAGGGARQVTILSLEAWTDAVIDLGRDDLDPCARRANVVVSGVDLGAAIGRALRLGGCLVQVVGETRPCRLMDDAAAGLQAALGPERRGGVYGRIVASGEIAVGDAVAVEDLAATEQAELPFGEGEAA